MESLISENTDENVISEIMEVDKSSARSLQAEFSFIISETNVVQVETCSPGQIVMLVLAYW